MTKPESQKPIAARETFDQVAALYDAMRPTYPERLFEDVIAFAGIAPDARLFEIGCGTGHATIGFAERGFAIDAVELGENMAAIAREKFARFPAVRITTGDFDRRLPEGRYDLAYCASAWHWLDPATRQSRVARILRDAGTIALWRNFHVRTETHGPSVEFFPAAQTVYEAIAPQLAVKSRRLPTPAEAPMEIAAELQSGGIFGSVETRDYLWRLTYTAEEYVRMQGTHSEHRLLPAETRRRLFAGLVRLIEAEFGGIVVKDHLTRLHLAKKLS